MIDIEQKDLDTVRAILKALLPKYAQIWVFGSRATLKARRGSDLDLAIEAHRKLSRLEIMSLESAFDESTLPYTVDIVDLHQTNNSFKDVINKTKVPLNL